jgi:hypothetical protein
VRACGQDRPGAGYRPADPDLAGYVVLDFGAFDAWYEEDERNVGHPRDPFHRIDVLASSRHVRLELDGQLLAESSRPVLLFETMLPVRSPSRAWSTPSSPGVPSAQAVTASAPWPPIFAPVNSHSLYGAVIRR